MHPAFPAMPKLQRHDHRLSLEVVVVSPIDLFRLFLNGVDQIGLLVEFFGPVKIVVTLVPSRLLAKPVAVTPASAGPMRIIFKWRVQNAEFRIQQTEVGGRRQGKRECTNHPSQIPLRTQETAVGLLPLLISSVIIE